MRKKKVKPGVIELHPVEPIIIVNYEMQLINIDKNGNSHVTEKQHCQKKIKIKTFKPNSNISKIANGVIEHCKYIHPSKEQHIVSLLQTLKQRLFGTETDTRSENEEENSKFKELQMQLEHERNLRLQKEKELDLERQRINEEKMREKQKQKEEEENERKLEIQRKEKEENEKKLETQKINEEKLREKQEENKKKFKLQKKEKKKMKKLMKQQLKIEKEMEKNMPKEKAGIEHLDKYIENLYENDAKTKIYATYHILQLVQEPDYLSQFVDNKILIGALGRMLQEDRKKNNELISNILEIFFCFSNFSELHPILINYKIGATTMQIISHENKRYELSNLDENANEMKSILFLHRQEKLLYICFYVLLNLAEDLQIETKMVQLGIVKYIMKTLQRVNTFRTWLDELFILLLTFAKKLSLFVENKNKFIEMGIVGVLFKIINDTDSTRTDVETSVIRLLFNLSFDVKCKQQICECGLLSWIVECLRMEHVQEFAVKCLYNLSLMDEYKSQICYTNAVVIITEMIIDFQDRLLPSEIIALGINISTCKRAIDIMCGADNDYLTSLIKRVHRTFDPLLMKLIHNVSCSSDEKVKIKLKKHLHALLGMAKSCESQEFLVEVLGTIANLSYHGTTEIVAYHELITQYNLLDFFTKLLSHTLIEDDLLISIIMVIGCFASTSKACCLFAESRLLRVLLRHIYDKLYDEEISLQSIYTIFKLLLHQDSREYICREPQSMKIIQQLSNDKNTQIKMLAELCLDIIVNYGDEWIESIRDKRFEQHNYEWIQFIESLTETQNMDNLRPLSPTHLLSSYSANNNDEDDDFMDDIHSSMQLKNMYLLSDDEDDEDEDENQQIISNIQRLSMFN